MKDDNCIFCKLANGVIPTNKIYEDDDFTVILDASPATKGHALILPKEHFANIYEINDETAAKVMPLAKKMAKQLQLEVDDAYDKCVDPQKLKAAEKAVNLSEHLFPGGMSWTDIREGRWEKHSLAKKYHMEKEKLKKIWRGKTGRTPSVHFIESFETDENGNVWMTDGCNRWLINEQLEKEGEKLPEPEVIEFTANVPVGHSLILDDTTGNVYMLAEAALEIKENPDSDFSKECIAISSMINGWLRNADGAKRYNDKVFV